MTNEDQVQFEKLLQRAAELRGHLCVGLPSGLKMAQLGLQLLNMSEEEKRENLVVFVETDRCPVDAIQIATGCSAGSRRLKMMDYGKSAATFVDGATGKGYRIMAKKNLKTRAFELAIQDKIIKVDQQVEEFSKLERKILMNAYIKLPPKDLFDFQKVRITWNLPILPSTNQHDKCAKCSEEFSGDKGSKKGDKIFCNPCAKGSYYEPI